MFFNSLRMWRKEQFVPYSDPMRRYWTRTRGDHLDPLVVDVVALGLLLLGVVLLCIFFVRQAFFTAPESDTLIMLGGLAIFCGATMAPGLGPKRQLDFPDALQSCANLLTISAFRTQTSPSALTVADLAQLDIEGRKRLATVCVTELVRAVLIAQEEDRKNRSLDSTATQSERRSLRSGYDVFLSLGLIEDTGYDPYFRKLTT